MPRIIAGWAGSLPLTAPASATRPTSDRVREALFSALAARDAIEGSRVLDLYAGSGALGLEAVSRGGTSAVLVDRSNGAAKALRENVARLRRGAPPGFDVRIVVKTVGGYLASLPAEARFDLVFLDPPYDQPDIALLGDLEALHPHLEPGAVVVVERSARGGAPAWPEGFEPDRVRSYGNTALHLLEAV
ncbi:16S rRNA (guanine(966)-N(2))-methyltransferase RsmD [Amnibacterium sp. CER49]|uniref:16S rRNA (guanine(966)-N(2))-methyltransferase RsmD n=1 Tax=Amnibacterium sp. CER49 TaxID=3039161 RepID=UPI00244D15BE|nr:16S rRNA (guanine(966)-N(2))-methyltransferase RsmD [Amnibacterium sp. CER49]MDH2442792.1 16S rRNA (guanine(966)-N(2))-methyltransferase RsmD [Amnibacterium sp. CER49]